MEAGKLRHRVTIQTPVTQRTKSGGFKEGTNTKRTVWGQVRPLSGRELLIANQVDPRITHEVRVRGGTDIKQTDRIIHKGRELEIESIVDVNEIDREIVMRCMEKS